MIDLMGYLFGIILLAFVISLAFHFYSTDAEGSEQSSSETVSSHKIKTEPNTTKALAQIKVRTGETGIVKPLKGQTVYSATLTGEVKTLLIKVIVKIGKVENQSSFVIDFEKSDSHEFIGDEDFGYKVVVAKVEPKSQDPNQFYSVLIYKK